MCIPESNKCDRVANCELAEDEDVYMCMGEYRLNSGPTNYHALDGQRFRLLARGLVRLVHNQRMR